MNHSQNFQNSKRPNFGGGLANATTQNRLGIDTRNPVLGTEDDDDDQAVYEQEEFESIVEQPEGRTA